MDVAELLKGMWDREGEREREGKWEQYIGTIYRLVC